MGTGLAITHCRYARAINVSRCALESISSSRASLTGWTRYTQRISYDGKILPSGIAANMNAMFRVFAMVIDLAPNFDTVVLMCLSLFILLFMLSLHLERYAKLDRT